MENDKTYNITQLAKMFKVASSLIRYWESEFDILNPSKDEKGNRIYTEKDVDQLRIVYHLVKEKGFTLKGAKKALHDNKEDVNNRVELITSLKNVKELLNDLKKQFD